MFSIAESNATRNKEADQNVNIDMKNSKKLIGGLIAGTAIGIAVGILLAPTSGEKTRKRIVDGSLKLKDDLMASVDDSIEKVRKQINTKIDQLTKSGKEVINHASEKAKV